MESFNLRTKERISGLKDRTFEIIQSEGQIKKKKMTKESLGDMVHNKKGNIHSYIMRIQREKRKEQKVYLKQNDLKLLNNRERSKPPNPRGPRAAKYGYTKVPKVKDKKY